MGQEGRWDSHYYREVVTGRRVTIPQKSFKGRKVTISTEGKESLGKDSTNVVTSKISRKILVGPHRSIAGNLVTTNINLAKVAKTAARDSAKLENAKEHSDISSEHIDVS